MGIIFIKKNSPALCIVNAGSNQPIQFWTRHLIMIKVCIFLFNGRVTMHNTAKWFIDHDFSTYSFKKTALRVIRAHRWTHIKNLGLNSMSMLAQCPPVLRQTSTTHPVQWDYTSPLSLPPHTCLLYKAGYEYLPFPSNAQVELHALSYSRRKLKMKNKQINRAWL